MRWPTTPTSPWLRPFVSPYLLAPVLVLVLLVDAAACYAGWTRSQPTIYQRGGAFESGALTPGPSATTAPSAAASTTTAAPGSAPPTPGGLASPTTTLPPATARAQPTSTDTTTGAPTPAPAAGVGTPTTGTYALHVSGDEHVAFGPVPACDNTFPSQSTLVVSPAAGEPSGSYDFDQRFYPASPNQHDERHIYRYAGTSEVLSYEEATVTCSGFKQSTTVDYAPVQLRVQLPLSVGASWSSRGGDSARTETTKSTVTGRDTITVGGVAYPVWVISTHVTMTGSESGTRQQTWWWSPARAMALQWREVLSASRSGASYDEDATFTVVRLP